MTRHEVIASLEGTRIVLADGICERDEYDFEKNCWINRERRPWPLPQDIALSWLEGWNNADHFKALNLLTCPKGN